MRFNKWKERVTDFVRDSEVQERGFVAVIGIISLAAMAFMAPRAKKDNEAFKRGVQAGLAQQPGEIGKWAAKEQCTANTILIDVNGTIRTLEEVVR